MFDQISPTYDRVNRILSFGMDRRWRRRVFSFLPPHKDLQLLDLATGTGDLLISLFDQGAPISLASGIDLSVDMIAIAKEKVKIKPYRDQIEWLRADAECLPFVSESFDVATFSFGIRNVSSPLRSLREIHRTLKERGRCLILEFSLPPQPIQGLYLLYLRYILPRIGGYLSQKPSAYRYLNQTIETFPSGQDFCSLMETAGFQRVSQHRMALGAVTLYTGEKS